MQDLRGVSIVPPAIAYDPVTRVVTITPAAPLDPGQGYRVVILSPQNDADPLGLRAIDGATLDPSTPPIEFTVLQPDAGVDAGASPAPALPTMSFCADVLPVLTTKCGSSICHGGTTLPADGLRLDSPTAVTATALGRVAVGSNRGPRSTAAAVGSLFGVDMPIVDPGTGTGPAGDPGDSWLLYKLLMAVPPRCVVAAGVGVDVDAGADAGASAGKAPTDVSGAHQVLWQPLSPAERDILSSLIPGREMPFPTNPSARLDQAKEPLTCDELERISLWIAQGAVVPSSCP